MNTVSIYFKFSNFVNMNTQAEMKTTSIMKEKLQLFLQKERVNLCGQVTRKIIIGVTQEGLFRA